MFVTFLEAGPNLNFKQLELRRGFGVPPQGPLPRWLIWKHIKPGLRREGLPRSYGSCTNELCYTQDSTCVWFGCWAAKLCFQSGGHKIGVMGASISSLISEAKCTGRAVKIKRACRDHPHFWAKPRHPHYDKFRKMLQAGFHCGRNVKSVLWPLPKVARNQKPVPHWKSIMEFRSHCWCGKKTFASIQWWFEG